MPKQDLHLDFETYCDLDLKKVGVHQYVAHASFRVLAAAWKFSNQPTLTMVSQQARAGLPPELVLLLQAPDVQTHAWNAAFETAVLERLGLRTNPLSCTMQRALAYGLPGKLETAAAALGLGHQKDMAGHRLMKKMTRPLKPGAPPWTSADYVALARYCGRDVEAEAAAAGVIPELQPEEAKLSELDALMNNRGELGIDLTRVVHLSGVAEAAGKADAKRCAFLTAGTVTSPGTQTKRLLAWLGAQGLDLPDTTKDTIKETLACSTVLAPDVLEVLQIRLRAAKTSTHKLQSMLVMSEPTSRALRGQFQFYGAARTGRWSGRGVQVQNMPRVPPGFSPDLFAHMATACTIRGDMDIFDAITPAPVLDCVSWALRSCLKATDDTHALWSFDFSQIEARVLAWLAGQQDVLDVFASGTDVYVWAAGQFGSTDRQLGKVLILALGFGMGEIKLRETARKAYGVQLTPPQAKKFKEEWRRRNPHIVQFWAEMEFAAKEAILNLGRVYAVGGSGVAFQCTTRTLQMRLPSGRVLYYHKPRLEWNGGGSGYGGIVYWGSEVGGRWVEQRTWGGKLAENATQAAARDIMAEAMLRMRRRHGSVPCMTVHDELVYAFCSAPLEVWRDVMLEPPPWAGGLPLAGESKTMRRYSVVNMPSGTVAKSP
jgi:DNA polymerase